MKVKIDKLDHFGRGITKIDNKVTFVPFVLPDEEIEIHLVKQKKNYNEAICSKIYNRSIKRVVSFCPYFEKCGGCDLQHLKYEDTLVFKKEKIINLFEKAKLNFPIITIQKSLNDKNYRNKITLKVINGQLGYYEKESHNIIAVDDCFISNNVINKFINELKSKVLADGEIVIRCNHNEEVLLIFKGNYNFGRDDFSKNLNVLGIVINGKTVYGVNYLTTNINNTIFKYSYDSFFQVNNEVANYIFNYIKNETSGGTVLDLYCGVGTLSLMASCTAKKVYGIEIVPNAIKNAIENARMNNRDNLEFMLGDVSKVVDNIKEKFDTIIVDPPRKGLDKYTKDYLLKSNVETIIYVSCDPVTLTRDLTVLQEKYVIKEVKLFDMFPYTYHVETVVKLILK